MPSNTSLLRVKSATSHTAIVEDAVEPVTMVTLTPFMSLIHFPHHMICCMLETKINVSHKKPIKNTGLKIRSRNVWILKYWAIHFHSIFFSKTHIKTAIGETAISNRRNNILTRLAMTSPIRHHTKASKMSNLSARLIISAPAHDAVSLIVPSFM
jgi:hypothetical protein